MTSSHTGAAVISHSSTMLPSRINTATARPYARALGKPQTSPTIEPAAELSSDTMRPGLTWGWGESSSTLRLQLITQLCLVRIHRRHKGKKAVLLRVHFLKCAPQHWGPAGSRGDAGPNSQRSAAHPVPGRVTAHTSIIKGSKRYLQKSEFNLTQISLGNLLVPGHFTP